MTDLSPLSIAKELEIEPDEYFVNIVSVDAEAYAKEHFNKSVRKNLTIPALPAFVCKKGQPHVKKLIYIHRCRFSNL